MLDQWDLDDLKLPAHIPLQINNSRYQYNWSQCAKERDCNRYHSVELYSSVYSPWRASTPSSWVRSWFTTLSVTPVRSWPRLENNWNTIIELYSIITKHVCLITHWGARESNSSKNRMQGLADWALSSMYKWKKNNNKGHMMNFCTELIFPLKHSSSIFWKLKTSGQLFNSN